MLNPLITEETTPSLWLKIDPCAVRDVIPRSSCRARSDPAHTGTLVSCPRHFLVHERASISKSPTTTVAKPDRALSRTCVIVILL
ncbi:MAG: hypothetical protein ACHQX3_08950 [Nitrospirales bacterium]